MLVKLAALGGLGYLGYNYYKKNVAPRQDQKVAYAGGTGTDTWDSIEADPVVPARPATTGTTGSY